MKWKTNEESIEWKLHNQVILKKKKKSNGYNNDKTILVLDFLSNLNKCSTFLPTARVSKL